MKYALPAFWILASIVAMGLLVARLMGRGVPEWVVSAACVIPLACMALSDFLDRPHAIAVSYSFGPGHLPLPDGLPWDPRTGFGQAVITFEKRQPVDVALVTKGFTNHIAKQLVDVAGIERTKIVVLNWQEVRP